MGWAGPNKQVLWSAAGAFSFFSGNVCIFVKKVRFGWNLNHFVVLGGRDNERFSKFATLFEKGAFWVKLEQNLPIWGQNRKDK